MPRIRGNVVVLLASLVGAAESLQGFGQPFTAVDAKGQREIAGWNAGGSTQIHKGFARLTTDRQSKSGYLWSREALGGDDFSVVMQFRISGQGSRLYGDGVALWLSTAPRHTYGTLHGAPEAFTGVGVVVDTFRNTEAAAHHKDVAVLVNDGSRRRDAMQRAARGCDVPAGARVRHHEGRADFVPADATARLKVQVSAAEGVLRVSLDASARGEWHECAVVPLGGGGGAQRDEPGAPALPAAWWRGAHVGITASTGQLADNHDVLALGVFAHAGAEDSAALGAEDARFALAARPAHERHGHDALAAVAAELATMRHSLEHKVAAMREGLQNAVEKLRQQEQRAEERIQGLEQRLRGRVHDGVAAHAAALRQQLQANVSGAVDERLHAVGQVLDRAVGEHLADTAAQQSGWRLPFGVLALCLSGLGVKTKLEYTRYKKSHLL